MIQRSFGLFDIITLWEITKNNPLIQLNIEDLVPCLDDWVWKCGTPSQVWKKEVLDDENHIDRIKNADLQYPVLISENFDIDDESRGLHSKYDCLDGLHRLSHLHFIMQQKQIVAQMVTWEQLQSVKLK